MIGNKRIMIYISLIVLMLLLSLSTALAQDTGSSTEKPKEASEEEKKKELERAKKILAKKKPAQKELRTISPKILREALTENPEHLKKDSVREHIRYLGDFFGDTTIFESKTVTKAFFTIESKGKIVFPEDVPSVAVYNGGLIGFGKKGDTRGKIVNPQLLSSQTPDVLYAVTKEGSVLIAPDPMPQDSKDSHRKVGIEIKEGTIRYNADIGRLEVEEGVVTKPSDFVASSFRYKQIRLINSIYEVNKKNGADFFSKGVMDLLISSSYLSLSGTDIHYSERGGFSFIISGGVRIRDDKSVWIRGTSDNPSTLFFKGMKVSINWHTFFSWDKEVYKEPQKHLGEQYSKILFDGSQNWRIIAKEGVQLSIDIDQNRNDGSFSFFSVDKINDISLVKIRFTGGSIPEGKEVLLTYSENPPLVSGPLDKVHSSLSHKFSRWSKDGTKKIDYLFVYHRGVQLYGKPIGEVSKLFSLKLYLMELDPGRLSKFIEDARFDKAEDITELIILVGSSDDPGVLRAFVKKAVQIDPTNAYTLLGKVDDPDLQKKMIEQAIVTDSAQFLTYISHLKTAELRKLFIDRSRDDMRFNDFQLLFEELEKIGDKNVISWVADRTTSENGLQSAVRLWVSEDQNEIDELISSIPINSIGILSLAAKGLKHDGINQAKIYSKVQSVGSSLHLISFFGMAATPEIQKDLYLRFKELIPKINLYLYFSNAKNPDVQMFLLDSNPGVEIQLNHFNEMLEDSKSVGVSNTLISRLSSIKPFVIDSTDDFSDDLSRFRKALFELQDSDQISQLVSKAQLTGSPGWEKDIILNILNEPDFQKQISGLPANQIFDVAESVSRHLEAGTTQSVSRLTSHILHVRETNKDVEFLGPNVNYLLISHDEVLNKKGDELFSNSNALAYAYKAGVKPEKAFAFKGVSGKRLFLAKLSTLSGPTTIHFNGHSHYKSLGLTDSRAIVESGVQPADRNIGISELVDIFITRQENGKPISDVRVALDGCFTHDYAVNLYNLLKERGAKSFPIIFAVTNRDQYAYSFHPRDPIPRQTGIYSPALAELIRVNPSGTLTVGDLYKVRPTMENPSLFVPHNNKIENLGSSYDNSPPLQGYPLNPGDDDTEDSDSIHPPNAYVQIAQVQTSGSSVG